jgi:acyl-CoA thioesterase
VHGLRAVSAALPNLADNPFLQELGLEFLEMADGAALIALVLEPRHMNGWHVAHGGVTMTLLDVVMSMAGRSLEPGAVGGVTIDLHVSFLQPAGEAGARLIASGKAYQRTKTMCFCEGEVWNGSVLVAKAMATFKYLRRLDVRKKLLAAPAAATDL